ncbi:pre-mRNA-splicing regulator female-lethal(2)D [Chironomus tepperi]|uniref:pre-mRNA-splicing regulator female-lethal(2)D n=1 Tax=Chironomus tepperi TaxID=113505 RepID=UPI00391FC3D0
MEDQSMDLDTKCKVLEDENEKLKAALKESQRREKLLMRRNQLNSTQQLDFLNQLNELKYRKIDSNSSTLFDPAVNIIFTKLKNELKATKAKLEDTQNELTAWKFTPDSNTGKRLMAKCRLLYQENEELGKVISNGRLAKLETELAIQKNMNEELKRSHSEFEGIIQDFDIDMEGLTTTIINLQQKLKVAEDKIVKLEKELKEKPDNDNCESLDANDVDLEPPSSKRLCVEN